MPPWRAPKSKPSMAATDGTPASPPQAGRRSAGAAVRGPDRKGHRCQAPRSGSTATSAGASRHTPSAASGDRRPRPDDRTGDFAASERLGNEFAADVRLLNDLGWNPGDGRETFLITVSAEDFLGSLWRPRDRRRRGRLGARGGALLPRRP